MRRSKLRRRQGRLTAVDPDRDQEHRGPASGGGLGSAAGAGMLLLAVNLTCAGVGAGIGALVGALLPLLLAGFFAGFFAGIAVVIKRFGAR